MNIDGLWILRRSRVLARRYFDDIGQSDFLHHARFAIIRKSSSIEIFLQNLQVHSKVYSFNLTKVLPVK